MGKKMELDSQAFRQLARDRQDATVAQLTEEAYKALSALSREHGIDIFEDPNIRLLRVCLTGIKVRCYPDGFVPNSCKRPAPGRNKA